MTFVSLPIEILRTQPRLVFWLAALAQALAWFLVPALFYAAPPGDLPELLALARHGARVADVFPPLAYWLAEIAMRLGGVTAVYLLSQLCILVALWAVFALGSATLGARHAALGTLLLTGVYFVTVPTPDFSPAILAAPLWALALLHLWRALSDSRTRDWLMLAAALSLLLLTTYLATLLVALVAAFVLLHPQARARLARPAPIAAAIVVLLMLIPHAIWIRAGGAALLASLPDLRSADLVSTNLSAFARILGLLLLGHAGLAVLVAVAASTPRQPRAQAELRALVTREKESELAATFILFFALVPGLILVSAAVIAGYAGPMSFAPVVILSGLACVLAAGEAIALYRQRHLVLVWCVLLLAPPLFAAATTMLLLPWSAARDARPMWPAQEMGRFFTDNFERRTGRRLEVVAGDPAFAPVIAAGSASRPFVFAARPPGVPQFLAADTLATSGAVVVWRATDDVGTPPADIRAQFPGLVPEVPRVFERRVDGRLPPLRLGWAVIRPQPAQQTVPAAAVQ